MTGFYLFTRTTRLLPILSKGLTKDIAKDVLRFLVRRFKHRCSIPRQLNRSEYLLPELRGFIKLPCLQKDSTVKLEGCDNWLLYSRRFSKSGEIVECGTSAYYLIGHIDSLQASRNFRKRRQLFDA